MISIFVFPDPVVGTTDPVTLVVEDEMEVADDRIDQTKPDPETNPAVLDEISVFNSWNNFFNALRSRSEPNFMMCPSQPRLHEVWSDCGSLSSCWTQ